MTETIKIKVGKEGNFTFMPSTRPLPLATKEVKWECTGEDGTALRHTVQFSDGSPFTKMSSPMASRHD